nr:hypothetical protein [Tanacetum cinerariifolium]
NINTTQAQQKALDDALVAPADHLEFRKCNMRLKTDIKLKEARFQVVLDALTLTPFYQAFLITADVPAIICKNFRLQFLFLRQEFEDLSLEHDILSFIKDLGHTGNITYLTDVNVDYLHQPRRSFATVINKCLSGKNWYRQDSVVSCSNPLGSKLFWHTARDDTMFTSIRCISRHEKTQVYGTILPKELTNQAMLESKAYKTYYAFASREKTPKPKL